MSDAQDFGTLERGDDSVTIRFSRLLPHPPHKVWRALTEADHLDAWFPTTIEGEFNAGASLVFRFSKLAIPPMHGRMIACEPPKLLEFTWDDETLRFELDPYEAGTRLGFTATFAEIGKAARDAAGWHVCLELLADDVAGRVSEPLPEGQRWREVHPHYVAAFGPDAAAIGPPQEWQDEYGPA
jgi:uncharacterized protein YndB with AHSA1/START domain